MHSQLEDFMWYLDPLVSIWNLLSNVFFGFSDTLLLSLNLRQETLNQEPNFKGVNSTN